MASEPANPKCSLDENHSVSLLDILVSFNAPISEEHAWALCYQCAKCFKNNARDDLSKCRVVTQLQHVLLHRDGHVHPNTVFAGGGSQAPGPEESRTVCITEQTITAGLGLVLFKALDFGMEEDEERHLSPELTRLIQNMTGSGTEQRTHCETDDEGIERDAGEVEEENGASLALVLHECTVHLGGGGAQEADSHYKAVCRALVAEALELSTFLERVSHGTEPLTSQVAATSELKSLNFNDWARLWVQVIRELRRGVQLKKVCYTRKPIEYELTPYEILMEDIRARRYKLKKVMVDGTIPHRVKKDAHAIILEFIRSRPPLRKASERKLAPPRTASSTPRERLMESIKQGHAKLRSPHFATNTRLESNVTNVDSGAHKSTRRLIKVDFSAVPMDDEEEDEEIDVDDEERRDEDERRGNPWQRTGSRLSEAEIHQYCDTALQCRLPSQDAYHVASCTLL